MSIITSFVVATCAVGDVDVSMLVYEGQALAGSTVGAINSPAVNGVGGFGCTLNTIDGVSHVWGDASGGPGAILHSETTIGIYEQTSFESFWGLADDGGISYSASCTNTKSGSTSLDSVFFDDTLVIIEEEPVDGEPGWWWSFGSRPATTRGGTPYWVGGWTDTQGGSTDVRGLFYGFDATVIYMAGEAVCDLPFPIEASIDFDYRFSADGTNHIIPIDMATGSSTDDNAMAMNGCGLELGGSLVREGTTVPVSVGGIGGEAWDNFDFCGVTESGSYFFTGDTDGDTATDEFIVVDGAIAYREGDTVDGEVLSGSIESAYINEHGDLAYIWDIDGGDTEALFLDDRLLLAEGDGVDLNGDGSDDATLLVFTGIAALAVSDRMAGAGAETVDVYCTADVDDGIDVFEILMRVSVSMDTATCAGDVNGSGTVDVDDLLTVLADWGPCGGCAGDVDGDGDADVDDLLVILANWGACP